MINEIHNSLSENYQSYRKWHLKSYHHHIHWAGLAMVVVATGIFLTTSISTTYAAVLPTAMSMSGDNIPDFSQDSTKPTVTAIRSGSWSDPSIWSKGTLPSSSEIVVIPSGQTVTYDSNSGTAYTLSINGSLKFRNDIDTKLSVTNIEVMSNGYFEIGTVSAPINQNVKAEIVIANTPINTTIDPEQWGTGFISFGKVSIHGAVKDPTFIKVATEPLVGQNTITLSQNPIGWQVGDRIFIPDTRFYRQGEVDGDFYPLVPQWEEFTVQGISGATIVLNKPLAYNHKGARDANGNLDFLPHVGNLSRNILIRSENPLGTRGHIAMIHMADADIRYATFKDLGRTTYDPLSTTNQKGRYALHMHHGMGPMISPSNGYQFTLIGNAVDGGSSVHKFKWGITIHDSHYGLIKDNVVYNYPGAGIMTEAGNETLNVFDHNFVVRTDGVPYTRGNERGIEFGYEGAGIWLRGPNNILRNNVVANFRHWGIAYWHEYLGNVRIPNYKGADTLVAGQYSVVNGHTLVIPEDSNNEIYGSGQVGFTFWWLGSEYRTPKSTGTSVIKNLKIWHVTNNGIWQYPSSKVTFDGLVIRGGNYSSAQASCCGLGYNGGDYFGDNIKIINADIQNMSVGISPTTDARGALSIENSKLINFNENIHMGSMWTSSCDARNIGPRLVLVKNVKFGSIGTATKNIQMEFSANAVRNIIQKDEVYVTDYNQVGGNNFRVFYKESDPSVVVPQGYYSLQYGQQCVSLVSTPVGGLTNTQSFTQYGYAVGGTPATCTDSATHPEIKGYTCPFTSIPTSPLASIKVPTGFVGGPITNTNSTTGSTTTATTSPAPVLNLVASHLVVNQGSQSTLSWTTTNVTSCVASGGWTGTKSTNSSEIIKPASTASYTLSCTGPGGIVTKFVTVTVNSTTSTTGGTTGTTTGTNTTDTTAPTITAVTKSNITSSSATISWTTNEPANTQIEFMSPCPSTGCITQLVSTLTTSHSTIVSGLSPNTMYMFRLKSTDASGNLRVAGGESAFMFTTLQSAVTTVIAPTVTFSATPSTITSDGKALITWSTTNATSVYIDGGIGAVEKNGQLNVAPKTTTTYTINVTGSGSTKVTSSVTINVTAPVVTTTSASSLLGYWKLNSDAGLSVADSSGNSYSGTLMNGVSWAEGYKATALLFDGVNDIVDFGNISSFNITGDITLSAWINAQVPTETGVIIGKGACWGKSCPFSLRIGHAGRICFDQNSGGSGADTTCTTDPIPFNTWRHVAATRSGGKINIYVDGVLSGSKIAERSPGTNTGSLQIGNLGPDVGSAFKGKIDDVVVYKKALSASEIQTVMNQ